MLVGTAGRLIRRFGAACTLWRQTDSAPPNEWTAGVLVSTFLPCIAVHRPPRAYVIKGTLQEQSRLFLIDPASLAGVPQIGDRLALGTYTANAPGIRWHHITQKPELTTVAGVGAVYRIEVSE